MTIKICEIFESIQGESLFSGFPFFFIRVSGCNLRCSYCDSKYSYNDGEYIEINSILERVQSTWIDKVLITGGEPLCQRNVFTLMKYLLEMNKKVFIETNGSLLVDKVPKGVVKIVDFKTPSSNMVGYNNFENVSYLDRNDEVKFVISNDEDFSWSCSVIERFSLFDKVDTILFSPNERILLPEKLASMILDAKINVKLQIQLHKYLGFK